MMTAAELLALRGMLIDRCRALLDRLTTETAGMIEPGLLRLLADVQVVIAAVEARLNLLNWKEVIDAVEDQCAERVQGLRGRP